MAQYKFDEIVINSTEKKKPKEEDKYTYLGLEHLDSGSLRVSRFGADVAPIGEKLVMRKGDVLFGKRRAYQKKVAIAPFDGIFSAHGMVLRPRTEVISPKLFPFFISSNHFLDEAIKISVGSLSPTINWRDLKDLEFNIPPIEKQDSLADQLWAMEETKEAYNQLLLATDTLVKSQFIEMFGDISHKESKWDKKQFEDVFCDETRNGTKIQTEDYLDTGTYPIIDQGQSYIGGYRNERSGIYEDLPSIIFGDHTRIFKYVDKPFFLGADGVKLLRSKFNDVNYLFLYNQLQLAPIPNTGYNRHYKYLKEIDIILPPIELQNQFAAFVQQIDKSKFDIMQCILSYQTPSKF